MEYQKSPTPSPIDILTWKINNNDQFAEKVINDFDFAKKEFSEAGVEITPQIHADFRKGFELMRASWAKMVPDIKWKIDLVAIFVNPNLFIDKPT